MKYATLTFDNGPVPGYTERALDILADKDVKAVFFTVGQLLRDPAALALAQRAAAEGHRVGAHTHTHSVALGDRIDEDYAAQEISQPFALLGEAADPERLFRPYGRDGLVGPHLFSDPALRLLLEDGHTTILWNNIPGDWKDPEGWVEECLAIGQDQEWGVIVLHDIPDASLDRLEDLIDRLRELGVTFRTDFPDSVVVTRGGSVVTLDPSHVTHG